MHNHLPLSDLPFLAQALSRREVLKLTALLTGGALSTSVIDALAAGDESVLIPAQDVFPGDTRSIMTALTEMVIPRTDTPGAHDAGVPAFVEGIVANWYQDDERRTFIDGLLAIDTWCRDHHGKPFLQCTEGQREAALSDLASHSTPSRSSFLNMGDDEEGGAAPSFFNQLKELTTWGYCSSEIVSTQVFRYLPVPGHYDGHSPSSEAPHGWSY